MKNNQDSRITDKYKYMADPALKTGRSAGIKGRNRWGKAMITFIMLKEQIAQTLILKHFDLELQPMIVVYAIRWAVSAALLQSYNGVYWPVNIISRTFKINKINYGMVEKK